MFFWTKNGKFEGFSSGYFLAILCLAMLSVPVSKVDAEKVSGDWPMFHGSCHYCHRDDISICKAKN